MRYSSIRFGNWIKMAMVEWCRKKKFEEKSDCWIRGLIREHAIWDKEL